MKESIPELKRKIERLEAANLALIEARNKDYRISMEWLSEKVDYKIRIDQAMRILNGEEV